MENNTYVELAIADGSTMNAYVAIPENLNENTPAIIVLQEAFGVNGHMKSVTGRFASEGYIAICPELFHRTAPKGFEGDYKDFNSVIPHAKEVTTETLSLDLRACHQWLIDQPEVDSSRVFSVGYCMGGRASFVANAVLSLKAAISYYAGNMDAVLGLAPDLHGRHLFFWGGLDQHIPKEQIDRVTEATSKAGKDYINVVFANADHGFNSDDRPAFNPAASNEAWALTLQFLKDN